MVPPPPAETNARRLLVFWLIRTAQAHSTHFAGARPCYVRARRLGGTRSPAVIEWVGARSWPAYALCSGSPNWPESGWVDRLAARTARPTVPHRRLHRAHSNRLTTARARRRQRHAAELVAPDDAAAVDLCINITSCRMRLLTTGRRRIHCQSGCC